MNQVVIIVNYDDDIALPDDICEILADTCMGEGVTDATAISGRHSATRYREEHRPSLTSVPPG